MEGSRKTSQRSSLILHSLINLSDHTWVHVPLWRRGGGTEGNIERRRHMYPGCIRSYPANITQMTRTPNISMFLTLCSFYWRRAWGKIMCNEWAKHLFLSADTHTRTRANRNFMWFMTVHKRKRTGWGINNKCDKHRHYPHTCMQTATDRGPGGAIDQLWRNEWAIKTQTGMTSLFNYGAVIKHEHACVMWQRLILQHGSAMCSFCTL